jgi:hypothetical protein
MGDETCCICIEPIQDNDIVILSCSHRLHLDCAIALMSSDASHRTDCPICRKTEVLPKLRIETTKVQLPNENESQCHNNICILVALIILLVAYALTVKFVM